MENAEIPNPGSPSSNSGQQNKFLQNQQNKEASRTQMGGVYVDEKGGNVNEINGGILRMLQTDDYNLQVVADKSVVTAATRIQEIQAGNSIENESWEGVQKREGNHSGPSNKSPNVHLTDLQAHMRK